MSHVHPTAASSRGVDGAPPHRSGAPDWRTVHVVTVGLARREPVRCASGSGRRLGYLHCGSRDEIDQVRDVRVHAWDGPAWRVAARARDMPACPGRAR